MITDDRMAEIVLANKYSSDPLAIYRAIEAEVHEELRKQEPVAWIHPLYKESGFKLVGITRWSDDCLPLYAAPIPTVTPTTAVKEVWLCYAYGETEWPCVVIASNREQIRQFVIDNGLAIATMNSCPKSWNGLMLTIGKTERLNGVLRLGA